MRRWLKYVVLVVAVAVLVVGLWVPSYAKTAEGKYKFVYVAAVVGDPYYRPIRQGLDDAEKLLDVEVHFTGPMEADITKFVDAIAAAAADPEVDGIVTWIMDPVAQDDVIADAIKKGVPVITANADDEETPNARLSYIGDTMVGHGHILGKHLVELMDEKGLEGTVGIFMWGPQIGLLDRSKGVQEILNQHNIKSEETICGTSDTTTMAGMMESYVIAHPDCVAICGMDGASTPGVGMAIRNLGLKGKILGAGFDLVPATLDAVKDGYTQFTVDQTPYLYGFYSIIALYLYKEYDIYPSNILTGGAVVDASNVDKIMALMKEGYR